MYSLDKQDLQFANVSFLCKYLFLLAPQNSQNYKTRNKIPLYDIHMSTVHVLLLKQTIKNVYVRSYLRTYVHI